MIDLISGLLMEKCFQHDGERVSGTPEFDGSVKHVGQIDRMKERLGQVFRNTANCYSETTDGREHQAMSEEQFVEVVSELIRQNAPNERRV